MDYVINYNENTGRYDVARDTGTVIGTYGRRSDAVRGLARYLDRNEI